MHRVLIPACVIGSLVCAAVAFGGTTHYYHGLDSDSKCGTIFPPDPQDCVINFKGQSRHHDVKRVTDFEFKRIPIHCELGNEGISSSGGPLDGDMKVRKVNEDREFHGHFDLGQGRVDVAGRFDGSWSKARGTLKISQPDNPISGRCTSGIDHFRVKR